MSGSSYMNQLGVETFSGLSLARYAIHLRAEEKAKLPAFSGSTLRGAFGHALKQSVCVMDHRDCARCLVASRCIYPHIFETPFPSHSSQWRSEQNAPHPYTLDPPIYKHHFNRSEFKSGTQPIGDGTTNSKMPKWERHHELIEGDEAVFGLTLMGRASDHLPYIVLAIHEMTQRGLGALRSRFTLAEVRAISVTGESQTIYTEKDQRLDAPAAPPPLLSKWVSARLARLAPGDVVKLRFLTPTRIKVDDDLQPHAGFELLVRNLLRRVSMLTAIHGDGPMKLDYPAIIARAAEVETLISALKWWDWQRYSSRQQASLKMGGFVGAIVYCGEPLADFLPLIVAGEILRIGRGMSFGLGKYVVSFDKQMEKQEGLPDERRSQSNYPECSLAGR